MLCEALKKPLRGMYYARRDRHLGVASPVWYRADPLMERGMGSLRFSVGEMVGTLNTSVRDHRTSHHQWWLPAPLAPTFPFTAHRLRSR